MKNLSNSNPAGATSLLVVVGLGATLIAMVTGLTVLSVRESRQALDTDLSNRALSAAQAAAVDAAQQLSANPALEYPNCDGTAISNNTNNTPVNDLIRPVLSTEADNQVSIVCRTISSSGQEITGQLSKDTSTEILAYLGNSTGVDGIKLSWNKQIGLSPLTQAAFPTLTNWGLTPAALEVSYIYWPKSGPDGAINCTIIPQCIPASGLPIKTTIILPSQPQPKDPSPISGGSYAGNCNSTPAPYSCSVNIDLNQVISPNFANTNNLVVRIKSLYADTDFVAEFYNGGIQNSNRVNVHNTKAIIDVTAKAGDLYRRVVAEKPLGDLSYLDSVLYSESQICKKLTVNQDLSLVTGNNCP